MRKVISPYKAPGFRVGCASDKDIGIPPNVPTPAVDSLANGQGRGPAPASSA
jgi:hypothetical protein